MKSTAVFQELGLLASSSRGLDCPAAGDSHHYHHHNHFWDYCLPTLARPFAGSQAELFASFPEGLSLPQALERTGFLVFLGARRSPEFLAALADPRAVALVFEPDPQRMEEFLAASKPREFMGRGVSFFAGDPDRLPFPLLPMLPEALSERGYPLCFAAQGLVQAQPGYARRVAELVELFYYRTAIYPLDSQEYVRGQPIRPMTRNAILDRYKHLYENLEPCLRSGTLEDLRGRLPGRTAILAAAGPALAGNLDYLRENRERAVLIAVNTALKPLLAAGIEPHFTVINDTSVDSEPSLQGLPPLKRATLVAHCLSATGGGAFPRAYFFGNFPGQPFPRRQELLLHGSVITTAFSLAEWLGCTRALLAGVQLASPDPYRLAYARDTIHHAPENGEMPLTGRWPQLYPATAADGSTLYTTPNFFDAAQWFADRIALASLEVVNLCPGSILRGPKISFDPSPRLPEDPDMAGLLANLPAGDFSGRRDRVLGFIREEMARWKRKQLAARAVGDSPELARDFIAQSDQDNTSFMLQRFADFSNQAFHEAWFQQQDPARRAWAAAYFTGHMEAMCRMLLGVLNASYAAISKARPSGA